jgi:hypothetical protein
MMMPFLQDIDGAEALLSRVGESASRLPIDQRLPYLARTLERSLRRLQRFDGRSERQLWSTYRDLDWYMTNLGMDDFIHETLPDWEFEDDEEILSWMKSLRFKTGHLALRAARRLPELRHLLQTIRSLHREQNHVCHAKTRLAEVIKQLSDRERLASSKHAWMP